MIADTPQIVIEHPAEKFSVHDVAVERIARLLALADGVNPDDDTRCTWEPGSMSGTCTLQGGPIGSFAAWHRFAPKAEELLKQVFGR